MADIHSGGCQCGAVRYQVDGFGRASICHCRMCQKAFGNAFAPLVTTKGFRYTRGAAKHFRSSDKVRRGFCSDCGTPLTYEFEGFDVELALCTLDTPEVAPPVIQVNSDKRLGWCERIEAMPGRSAEEAAETAPLFADLHSNQHPDHDTDNWPPLAGGGRNDP